MALRLQKILNLFAFRAKRPQTAAAKRSARSGIDERKSTRLPVPMSRQACRLRVDGNVLAAKLENESEGGFGVVVDLIDGLDVGKMIELCTDDCWLPVQIIHIEEVARPVDTIGRREVRLRLGLKR